MMRLLKLRRVVVLKCFALVGVASLLITLTTSRISSSRRDVGTLEAGDTLERTSGRRDRLEIRAGIRSENVNSVGSVLRPGFLGPDREVRGTSQGQRHEQGRELSPGLQQGIFPFEQAVGGGEIAKAVNPIADASPLDPEGVIRYHDGGPEAKAGREVIAGQETIGDHRRREEPDAKAGEAPRAKVSSDRIGDADALVPQRKMAEVNPGKQGQEKKKRIRLIRKTKQRGKVVKVEDLGIKTVVVDDKGNPVENQRDNTGNPVENQRDKGNPVENQRDDKGNPVENQRAEYDDIWYSDIVKGNYRARKVHLNNVTSKGLYLTEELWQFDDPDSERLFLYNKLLQHEWHVNRTNLELLRKELAEDGVDSRNTLIMTRENSPVDSRYKFFASSKVNNGNQTRRLYYYSVTEELHRLIPEVSPFREKSYKTCAVVGNSGSLLNSGCGREIDSSDMVFRCNAAPLKKFAEDTGGKSNFTTFNPSIFHRKYNALTTREDYAAFQANITQYHGYVWMPCMGAAALHNVCLSAVRDRANIQEANPSIVVGNSKEFVNFWDFWKRRNFTNLPSTGFYIIHVALQLCDETHVYGFWPFPLHLNKGFERVPYHYFDDMVPNKKHGMSSEFSKVLQYHELGLLRLHTGECRGG